MKLRIACNTYNDARGSGDIANAGLGLLDAFFGGLSNPGLPNDGLPNPPNPAGLPDPGPRILGLVFLGILTLC